MYSIKTKTKGIVIASIAIVFISMLAFTLHTTAAKQSTGDIMDFSANLPFQINAEPGKTVMVPVDIYGSTTARNVNVVVTQADPKSGLAGVDTAHPQ